MLLGNGLLVLCICSDFVHFCVRACMCAMTSVCVRACACGRRVCVRVCVLFVFHVLFCSDKPFGKHDTSIIIIIIRKRKRLLGTSSIWLALNAHGLCFFVCLFLWLLFYTLYILF